MTIETEQTKSQTSETIRVEHPFSTIDGFSLQALFKEMQALIKECRVAALNDAIKAAYPKEPGKSVASYIPSFSSLTSFWPATNKKAAAKPTEDDEELSQDKPEPKDVAVDEEQAATSSASCNP